MQQQHTYSTRALHFRHAPESVPVRADGLIHMLPLMFLLLIGSLRGEATFYDQAVYQGGISLSPVTEFIKDNIWLLYAGLGISSLASLVRAGKFNFILTFGTALLLFLYIYGAVLTSFYGTDLTIKFLASLAMLVGIQVFLSSLASSRLDIVECAKGSLFLFSAILVVWNIAEYAAGNGFVPFVARYFGTAVHPNFIGVQMAVCSIVIASTLKSKNGWISGAKIALLLASIWLMYQSGSRTAVVVAVVGFATYSMLTYRLSTVMLVIIAAVMLGSITYASGSFDNFGILEVYDREGMDTRAGPWSYLWNSVLDAPILGHGVMPIVSENSLLRGWSAIGIVFPLILIGVVLAFAMAAVRTMGTREARRIALLAAVFFGLTVGSFFEGYLLDTSSLPIQIWRIALAVVGIDLMLRSGAARGFMQRHAPPATLRRTHRSATV